MSCDPLEQIEADGIVLRSLSIMPTIKTQSWDNRVKAEIQEEQVHGVVHLRVIPHQKYFTQTIKSDQLHTISYYDLAQRILDDVHRETASTNKLHQRKTFDSIEDLAEHISCSISLQISSGLGGRQVEQESTETHPERRDEKDSFKIQVLVEIPKLIRFSNKISVSITRHLPPLYPSDSVNSTNYLDRILIDQITCFTIIGLLPKERLQKQKVVCSLTIFKDPLYRTPRRLNLFKISESVFDQISKSNFFTIEALADSIADQFLKESNLENSVARKIKVHVEKPEAVSCALGAGVEIIRSA